MWSATPTRSWWRCSTAPSCRPSVVGRDDLTDIAVIRVKPAAPLPSVAWGDSRNAGGGRLGGRRRQPVRAGRLGHRRHRLGARARHRLGARSTTSSRSTRRSTPATPAARCSTSTAQVVGINSAIFSPTGSSVGIGFAIPSELASRIVGELREKGRIERGWLGVTMQDDPRATGRGDRRGGRATARPARAGLRAGRHRHRRQRPGRSRIPARCCAPSPPSRRARSRV